MQPGPVGEYLEVIDVDPASGVIYPPVDLDDPSLLAQDGLAPSEGNPQFHQQMVYAVAMSTIGHFERALGRVALWAPRRLEPKDSPTHNWKVEFVRRLRIYPQFGEPLVDLKKEPGQVWIGTVRPLAMRYGVLEERRLVIIAAIPVLLPKSRPEKSE